MKCTYWGEGFGIRLSKRTTLFLAFLAVKIKKESCGFLMSFLIDILGHSLSLLSMLSHFQFSNYGRWCSSVPAASWYRWADQAVWHPTEWGRQSSVSSCKTPQSAQHWIQGWKELTSEYLTDWFPSQSSECPQAILAIPGVLFTKMAGVSCFLKTVLTLTSPASLQEKHDLAGRHWMPNETSFSLST